MVHSQKGDNEISLQFINTDQKEEIQKEDDWLSEQFQRFPYMIYKLWLALTFIIALGITPNLILLQFKNLDELSRFRLLILGISSPLASFGSGEMLYAMVKRKSAFAQKSLIKLQYSIIGIVISLLAGKVWNSDYAPSSFFELCVTFALPISVIVSLFGGLAVLGIFKKNHPLSRLEELEDSDHLMKDFLEQNTIVSRELLKFDEKLNRWPYLIYRFWLKFVIVVEIILIFGAIMAGIPMYVKSREFRKLGELIFLTILYSLTVFCCYEMEVVLKTKILAKSKSAIFWLKICLFLSIIQVVITGLFLENTVEILLLSAYLPAIPLVLLIGAWNINIIIEKRDQFAKISSYSSDHYL